MLNLIGTEIGYFTCVYKLLQYNQLLSLAIHVCVGTMSTCGSFCAHEGLYLLPLPAGYRS